MVDFMVSWSVATIIGVLFSLSDSNLDIRGGAFLVVHVVVMVVAPLISSDCFRSEVLDFLQL